jgi:hypothetical protein
MKMRSLLLCAAIMLGDSKETSIINIIRHGEKCAGSGDDLTDIGYARADYLGRCMGSSSSSRAMPFGKATAVMAGEGKHSLRPKETAMPLSKKLGLKLHMPCKKDEPDCFAENALQYLGTNGTLVVAWAHESIPPLLKALKIPNIPSLYSEWPQACPSATFKEPSCCSAAGDSVCYDQIWQIIMERSSTHGAWEPQGISTLAEGFGGSSSSACAGDLASQEVQPIVV